MDLQQVAVWIVSFLAGGTASPLIEWIKNKLGYENGNAVILTAVAATIFTILTILASGELAPGTVGWDDFPGILFLVFQGAAVVFRKWIKKE